MSSDTDYALLRQVLEKIEPTGWAAEFGVYSGHSLGLIAKKMPVIGFDSFEGLPEDWRPGFPKGAFGDGDMIQRLPDIYTNIMLVKGWFADTVPNFPFPPLDLVHVDCDLYSSTVTVLDSIVRCIGPGTVIVFDEYEGVDFDDEKRAFHEWLDRYSVNAELIAQDGEEAAFVIQDVGFF